MTEKMTELEAMERLVGRPATMMEGLELVAGTITTPMVIAEAEGTEWVTHVTLEGAVIATTIPGLPLPVEEAGRAVRLEMIPVEAVEVM